MPKPSSGPQPDRAGLAGRIIAAALTAATPLAAASAEGEGVQSQLKEVQSALEKGREHQAELDRKAAALSREISALRAETIAVAKAIQDYEETLSATEIRLQELTARTAEKRDLLARRRAQIGGTLAALERLARRPPEALLVLPAPPVDAVHRSILLRAALPPLETRIRGLTGELAALAELRAEISDQQEDMRQATRAMKEKRSRLSVLMTRKQELRNRVRGDSRKTMEQVAKLAAEANDLRDLIARLEAAWPTPPPETPRGVGSDAPQTAALPPPGAQMGAQETAAALPPATQHPSGLESTRPFAAARGSLTFPARGQLVQRFGQPVGGGQSSRGIAMKARGGAQVVAPYDGEVVFAGPFRGYGQLLIIAHGDGYHILLAELSRIDSIVGQWVLAGEPVGVLGPSEDGSARLYVELRYNGEPINPLPWMAAREEKVSG